MGPETSTESNEAPLSPETWSLSYPIQRQENNLSVFSSARFGLGMICFQGLPIRQFLAI
jgi:hypothetical protein